MNMYRCTRPDVYGPGCPGHKDETSRQGHYIYATDTEDAKKQMKDKFPHDRQFDVKLWKEDVK